MQQLPPDTYSGDIHCVTTWSKLDTSFAGISVDTLLAAAKPTPEASFAVATSTTGYTTNLPLADVTGGKAWVVVGARGPAAADRARRPGPAARARTSTSGRARSGSRRSRCSTTTSPASGRSTATTTAATRGSSSATRVTDPAAPTGQTAPTPGPWQWATVESVRAGERARGQALRLALPQWTAHLPGQHYVVRLTADGRLQRQPVLLGGVAAGGRRRGRADRGPAARRGGLAVPDPGGHGRRRDRGARPDRRLLRLARRDARCCWWPAAPGSRR